MIMAQLTFEQIVRADLEIDAIVEYQAAMILSRKKSEACRSTRNKRLRSRRPISGARPSAR
jgi:hypothetical protein